MMYKIIAKTMQGRQLKNHADNVDTELPNVKKERGGIEAFHARVHRKYIEKKARGEGESERRWGSARQFVINPSGKYKLSDMYFHNSTAEFPGKEIREGVDKHFKDLAKEAEKEIKPGRSAAKYLAKMDRMIDALKKNVRGLVFAEKEVIEEYEKIWAALDKQEKIRR